MITDRIKQRPLPPEPDPEVAADEEKRRRVQALQDFLRPLGKLHQDCRLGNFKCEHDGQQVVVDALREYAQDMPAEVERGAGIILYGPSGSGKDHLLSAMARVAILHHGLTVRWENGADLFGEARDRISDDRPEAEWITKFATPDILYISDPLPPSGGLTTFQTSLLQRILDRRLRWLKPTWVSMNVASSAQADKEMGAALVDRLKPGAVVAYCKWPSHRKARIVWGGKATA